jgi:DNA-binding response OmpR family regulator
MRADEDGYDVLCRLRALEAERNGSPESYLRAISLTGYAEVEDRLRAQLPGCQAHLGKPVSPNDLIIAIRKVTYPNAGSSRPLERWLNVPYRVCSDNWQSHGTTRRPRRADPRLIARERPLGALWHRCC